jgi:hypothetical protein
MSRLSDNQPDIGDNWAIEIGRYADQTQVNQRLLSTTGDKAWAIEKLTDLEALYGALSQQAFKGELDLSRVPLPVVRAEAVKTVAAVLSGI